MPRKNQISKSSTNTGYEYSWEEMKLLQQEITWWIWRLRVILRIVDYLSRRFLGSTRKLSWIKTEASLETRDLFLESPCIFKSTKLNLLVVFTFNRFKHALCKPNQTKSSSRLNYLFVFRPRPRIIFLNLRTLNYGFGSMMLTGFSTNVPQGITTTDV